MRLKVGKFYDNSFGDIFTIVGQDENDDFIDHCGMKYNYRGESLFLSDYHKDDFLRSDKRKLKNLLSPLREIKTSFFQRLTLTDTKERAEKAFQSMKAKTASLGLKDGEFEEILTSETIHLENFNAIKVAQFVELTRGNSLDSRPISELSLPQLKNLLRKVTRMKFYCADSCNYNLSMYLDVIHISINSSIAYYESRKIKSQRPWQVYMKSVKARRQHKINRSLSRERPNQHRGSNFEWER